MTAKAFGRAQEARAGSLSRPICCDQPERGRRDRGEGRAGRFVAVAAVGAPACVGTKDPASVDVVPDHGRRPPAAVLARC
jgi:hypothetical protein